MLLVTNNIKDLDSLMINEYLCVNNTKNPFAKIESSLSKTELEALVMQYSLFPKNIISFFITALYNLNYHGWTDISSELTRNLNEELGQPLDNDENEKHEKFLYRPHYVIHREGILKGLGLDIKQTVAKQSTNNFLTAIKQTLDSDNPAIVGGATYALESSAIPELRIVSSLTERLFELSDKPMPDSLKEFFLFHIDEIEVGHRDRLIDTCSKYILLDKDMVAFESGFRQVLATMDIWWTGLSKEILENSPTHKAQQKIQKSHQDSALWIDITRPKKKTEPLAGGLKKWRVTWLYQV